MIFRKLFLVITDKGRKYFTLCKYSELINPSGNIPGAGNGIIEEFSLSLRFIFQYIKKKRL